MNAIIEERFWSKIVKDGPIPSHRPELGPCWGWNGAPWPKGYGRITITMRSVQAHRVAWELLIGPIPDGLFVCHHCDNPPCCRIDHLFIGTRAENSLDMWHKGRGRPHSPAKGTRLGERNPFAKLTYAAVNEIRAHPSVLAQRFGVAPATIYAVRKGETWRVDDA